MVFGLDLKTSKSMLNLVLSTTMLTLVPEELDLVVLVFEVADGDALTITSLYVVPPLCELWERTTLPLLLYESRRDLVDVSKVGMLDPPLVIEREIRIKVMSYQLSYEILVRQLYWSPNYPLQ